MKDVGVQRELIEEQLKKRKKFQGEIYIRPRKNKKSIEQYLIIKMLERERSIERSKREVTKRVELVKNR